MPLKCSNYGGHYFKLDLTLCNSSLLEITNKLEELGMETFTSTYQYDQIDQVISMDDLFKFESLDQNEAEYGCVNVTYNVTVSEEWPELFTVDNINKTVNVSMKLFKDLGNSEIAEIPFII